MLVRIVNMRGVDLNVFDFDFDLTWAGLFMNAEGYTYGRYGSRDEGPAESGLSLAGLKYAMQQALAAYRDNPDRKPEVKFAANRGLPTRVEKYPAVSRVKEDACLHCHQVNNFQHDFFWSKNDWSKDRMWAFPPPKNVGLELDVDRGDKVETVREGSPAARAGLQSGDILQSLNDVPVASVADAQYALNFSPKSGSIPVAWTRGGREHSGKLQLQDGWRESDISWRASMWTMPPAIGIYGQNLSAEEKRKLGLKESRLAFRQGNYVPPKTRQAGIRAKDIIIGVDGKELEMTMLQFNAHIRAHYDVGDKVTFKVIRDGKRLEIPMTLPVHPRD